MAAKKDRVTGLTPREEAFAQQLAKGLDQAEAFRIAHPHAKKWKPESVWQRASRMAASVKVESRVRQLQRVLREEAERKLRFGLADAFAMADEAFECAKRFEQAGAMVSAAMLKAKVAGLIVKKQEKPPGLLDGIPPEDIRRLHDSLVEAIEEDKRQKAVLPPKASVIDQPESGMGKPH